MCTVVNPAYPGTALRRGSSGSNVLLMQQYLNALKAIHPSLTHLVEDGKFGSATENTVKQYQSIQRLTVDGVIGRVTWNTIVCEYNRNYPRNPDTYPGFPLKNGSNNIYVGHMQTALNICADVYTAINKLTVDNAFGTNTENAVKRFQRQFGLTIDGVIGQNTWNRIITVRDGVQSGNRVHVNPPYPNVVLQRGSTGDSVRCIQSYLNIIRAATGAAWPFLTVDGNFGANTATAVTSYQAVHGLTVDGKVGPATWSSIVNSVNAAL